MIGFVRLSLPTSSEWCWVAIDRIITFYSDGRGQTYMELEGGKEFRFTESPTKVAEKIEESRK